MSPIIDDSTMQDGKYGEKTVDIERKKAYNETADNLQFERYRVMLGKNAPKNFSAFQKLKYSEDWGAFKAYSKSIRTGELTPLADFNLYKETSKEIDDVLVGQITTNGILITGKSDHFIARTIGLVEQRRNGVSVEDSLDTILNPLKIDSVCNNANGSSQRFIGKVSAVSINPVTGVLIQVNPLSVK